MLRHLGMVKTRCGWNATIKTGFQQVLERVTLGAKEHTKVCRERTFWLQWLFSRQTTDLDLSVMTRSQNTLTFLSLKTGYSPSDHDARGQKGYAACVKCLAAEKTMYAKTFRSLLMATGSFDRRLYSTEAAPITTPPLCVQCTSDNCVTI